MSPLLEVEDLHCVFRTPAGHVRAVDGVSFTIETGQSLGVVGESGSGKTVTALAMLRLFGPTTRARLSGSVRLDGPDLLRAPMRSLRRVRGGEVGFVFQDPLTSLDPVMSVSAQIAETLRLHRGLGRDAAEQREGVGVARVGEQLVARSELDDPASVHDRDGVAEAGHHAEVVRDQDRRGVHLAAERAQQVEDLGLHGRVERGRRLVGDQQGRVAGDGHGDHGPLAHAAGELVRVGADAALRLGYADPLQ
jgi:ABC-type dipeptide/oligopeptide/nickel transport system ATPase component